MDFDFKTNGTATTKGHANAPKDPTDLWSLITIISYVTLAFLLPIIGMIIANSISTGKGGTDPKGSSKSSSKKKMQKQTPETNQRTTPQGLTTGRGWDAHKRLSVVRGRISEAILTMGALPSRMGYLMGVRGSEGVGR